MPAPKPQAPQALVQTKADAIRALVPCRTCGAATWKRCTRGTNHATRVRDAETVLRLAADRVRSRQ